MSSSVTAKPVTGSQFWRSLRRIWRPTEHEVVTNGVLTIGLAISGGVDSMALAYLCSEVQKSHRIIRQKPFNQGEYVERLRFRAFIVDHGAREGSAEEAKITVRRLRKLGIPTTIQRLRVWDPAEEKPANFETVARRHRYRALGKACRFFRIQSLLLGHHEDDQAELVLMRIVFARLGDALKGMQPAAHIPECDGLYGVSRSGYNFRPDSPTHKFFALPNHDLGGVSLEFTNHDNGSVNKLPVPVAAGGVRIFRPLLSFNKNELIATCESVGVQWSEDATNLDKSLTARNTLRALIKDERLPRALSKWSMLRVAKRSQKRYDEGETQASDAFLKLHYKNLDTQTGVFSFVVSDGKRNRPLPAYVAKLLAKRMVHLVSPYANIETSKLGQLSDILQMGSDVPEHLRLGIDKQPESPSDFDNLMTGITFAGLYCTTREELVSSLDLSRNSSLQWKLQRQPYAANSPVYRQPVCTWTSSKTTPGSGQDYEASQVFGNWQLWDGRFWLRVYASTPGLRRIIARHLKPEDVQQINRDRSASNRRMYTRIPLAKDGRYSMPVLVADLQGPVLALPSIGLTLPQAGLSWQVKFKSIEDFRAHPATFTRPLRL